MKNAYLAITLFLSSVIAFAQPSGNRFNYKYRIKQSTINNYKHVLVLRANPAVQAATDPVYQVPTDRARPASITFDKGSILVDFWSILDDLDIGLPGNKIHKNAPHGVYEIKPNAVRTTLGDPTKAIKIKFDGLAVGVSAIPFRYRFKVKIDDQTKVNPTVTSPRPDVAITGGYLWGHSTFSKRGVTHWPKIIGAFFGVTAVDIKNGLVKSKSELFGTTKTQTNPAVTYGLQFTFGRNNFGILAGLGFESSIGKFSKDWIYQNQPFIGLGLVANAGIF